MPPATVALPIATTSPASPRRCSPARPRRERPCSCWKGAPSWDYATADGSGNWSITSSVLATGMHNLAARATDLAGNQTTSGTLAVTIGTTTTTSNWFDTNIQNTVIRTVGSQEFQDGLIDRNDMINLLRQVETTGRSMPPK